MVIDNCISDSYEECENCQFTSAVESSEHSESDDEISRPMRKRVKKSLPEDFVNSQDLQGRQG